MRNRALATDTNFETATATATGSESGWMKGHRQVVKETSIGEGQWPAHSLKLDPTSAVRVVAVATGPLLPPATAIQGQKWPKNWGDNPYLHGDHLVLYAAGGDDWANAVCGSVAGRSRTCGALLRATAHLSVRSRRAPAGGPPGEATVATVVVVAVIEP